MIDIHRYHADTTLRRKALHTIYERGQVSRGELTDILDLSLTSVTKFVGALMADGIVIECGALDSKGGRKTNLLGINPEYAYVLGVDIGGYAAKLGVVQMDGSLVEEWFVRSDKTDVPVENMRPEDLRKFIAGIFDQYPKERFIAICVGISGMVDHTAGRVIFCPNLVGWNDVLLADQLAQDFGLPIFVDTSARCMALAEQRYGSGKSMGDQILVSLGNYDIASALILGGRLYRGSGGFAGEIGHVMSSEKGERCTCGNYGCLELSATLMMITAAIAQQARHTQGFSPLAKLLPPEWDRRDLTPSLISQAIGAGDKICYEAVMTAGKHTGIALSNLLNVLNLGLVILGGSVVEFFPGMLDTIRNTIRERGLIPIGQNLEVRQARMDWRGAVVGSALLAMAEFFG